MPGSANPNLPVTPPYFDPLSERHQPLYDVCDCDIKVCVESVLF